MRPSMPIFAALALTAGYSLAVIAAGDPAAGDHAASELNCVPMPEAPVGHFVCEDRDSFERCTLLEGQGTLRIDSEPVGIPVEHCEQGG